MNCCLRMVFVRHLRFVKWVFFILLVFTIIVLLKMVLFPNEAEEILYEQEPWSDIYTIQMLKANFQDCIIHPSKVLCVSDPHTGSLTIGMNGKTNVTFFRNADSKSAIYPSSASKKHPLHDAFNDFVRLCDKYDVKVTLIEPSMLFCMLTKDRQSLLLKRRLNLTNLLGSENVLTLAVFDEINATKLEEPEVKRDCRTIGFHPHIIKMNAKIYGKTLEEIATHHFYIRHPIVIHVVVFFEKLNYYWHSGIGALPQEVADIVSVESLLFSQVDAIYERFLPVEIPAKPNVDLLYLPLDPQLFLHEIKTSRFLECNISHSFYVNKANIEGHSSGLSEEKFKNYAMIALRELKLKLRPFLMTFWIFGGTLLGWYRECGIIKYTSDVDFAAWATEIDDDKELIAVLKTNKYLILKQSMGMKKEAFELRFFVQKLMVDLFFVYEAGDHYWVGGHVPSKGYYFPYNYPKFTLCSADLLGYKVQVPCDSKRIILADYGQEWDKPISSWTYDRSPKNMGNFTYWQESEKSDVFLKF